MASTNTTSFGYIAEVTAGTTPATPAFQLLPVLNNSVGSNISTEVSSEIRADRQTDDLIVTDKSVGGDVGFELSYTPYKTFLTSLMQNSTTGSVSESTVTATTAGNILSKAGIDSTLNIGDVIRLTSATESGNDGIYIVTDNTTGGQVTVTPTFPASASAADYVVTVTTSVTNGSDTPDSYTLMTKMLNDSGTPYYHYARGCQVSSASLNIATGSIIDGSFSFVGLTEEATGTAISGSSETAIQAHEIMSGASSVGTVYVNGLALGTCSFSNMSISIDNQINEAKSIGTLGACALASFSLMISADVEVYFSDLTNYNAFLDSTNFSIAFWVDDGVATGETTPNAIGITLPYCKFESLSTPVSGKDAFLTESGTLRALRHPTLNYMAKLSFLDAV